MLQPHARLLAVVHAGALHKPDIARYPKQAFVDVNVMTGVLRLWPLALLNWVVARLARPFSPGWPDPFAAFEVTQRSLPGPPRRLSLPLAPLILSDPRKPSMKSSSSPRVAAPAPPLGALAAGRVGRGFVRPALPPGHG